VLPEIDNLDVANRPSLRHCWSYYLQKAKMSSTDRDHNCEHAWGDHMTDECPDAF
jgi:hypothetical protein